jgi:glutaredoxin 2
MKPKTLIRNKHLKLDQLKINEARKYFRVKSEQEAIDMALSLAIAERRITKGLQKLKRSLNDDEAPWPYL